MSNDERSRTYPTRPYLAVSAAIFRDGRVLIVRRARPPAHGLYTLPGGGVERGEAPAGARRPARLTAGAGRGAGRGGAGGGPGPRGVRGEAGPGWGAGGAPRLSP